MAQQLIETWHLAVLRLGLDVSGRTAGVTSALEVDEAGSRRRIWRRSDPLEAFGLAANVPATDGLHAAAGLVAAVAASVRDELAPQTALWLRILPASGQVAAVPWERDLLGAVSLPILRVPDRLPTTPVAGRTWRVALVVSARTGETWGSTHVKALVGALAASMQRDLAVDVFADVGTTAALRSVTRWPAPVVLHDPGSGQARFGGSGRIPVESWAQWITDELAGLSVSAVHLAGCAALDGYVPWLGMAGDPAKPYDHRTTTYASTVQLRSLTQAVGSPVLSFASPEGAVSDVAMRLIADSCGAARPGPTVYVDIGGAGAAPGAGERALAATHAFIADPQLAPMPWAKELFAYIQPELVAAALSDRPAEPIGGEPGPRAALAQGLVGGDSTDALLADADEVPRWVASSQRFVEAGVVSLIRSDTGAEAVATKASRDQGQAAALSEVRDLIAKYAQP